MPTRSVDEVRFFVGNGLRLTLERSMPDNADKDMVSRIFDEFVAYYKSHSNIYTKPYDGIVDEIRKMRDGGYKLAVVSNKRQEAVEELCQVFFKDLFQVIEGDRDGVNRKPAPDMVNHVLTSFGITPDQAVYIGDSDVDIQTAANSHMEGIFVSWGFRGREFLEEHGAGYIIDKPEELTVAVNSVFKKQE